MRDFEVRGNYIRPAAQPCAAGLFIKHDDAEHWPGWQSPCPRPTAGTLWITGLPGPLQLCEPHGKELTDRGVTCEPFKPRESPS